MALFIAIDLDPALAKDVDAAKKLDEVCPVDIYKATDKGVEIVDRNVDECTLCELCLQVGKPGQVKVRKLYDDTAPPLERRA
jgi:NAD-dependent dihydropyrimidine dehydrogenase PreA subunit